MYRHGCIHGGNGNDNDKCSCGWKQHKPSHNGCYLCAPIIGEIKKRPKMSISEERYHAYITFGIDLGFKKFIDFCYWYDYKKRKVNYEITKNTVV